MIGTMYSLYSIELEQHLLACLLKFPECYAEIAPFISEKDFCADENEINRTSFILLKQALDNSESINDVILAQRIKALGISFTSDVDPSDYIRSLSLQKTSKEKCLQVAQELKKYTVRRVNIEAANKVVKEMRSISPDASYSEIVERADKTFNENITFYDASADRPVNIFDEMEALVEERGENPITEFGMMGPHKRLNECYGSLLRPGNITVITARSAVGKTKFALDYCTRVSERYNNTPVLHFDNGEMSQEELSFRQCSAMSGVPMWLLETGKWRQSSQEVVDKVRATWKKIVGMRFHYFNVGGEEIDTMMSRLKRFYYSEVGRGNEMIFSFDYIKSSSGGNPNRPDHIVVGELVEKIKRTVQKDIVDEGKPMISVFTSVQSNRTGIVRNKNSSEITEDEGTMSLSDKIQQIASHAFILRQATLDEMAKAPGFGTHRFINIKARHLGAEYQRATELVRLPDNTLKHNYFCFDIQGFNVQEVGDLNDMLEVLGDDEKPEQADVNSDTIPKGL